MKGMLVGYDVGCTMGLTLGHGAWQIDRPRNGSMWNSYSFQPVDQWMGYSFTDLGAEGCCRSLNALFSMVYCNTAVSPLLINTQKYYSLVLSHRYTFVLFCRHQRMMKNKTIAVAECRLRYLLYHIISALEIPQSCTQSWIYHYPNGPEAAGSLELEYIILSFFKE